jgi:hypothetical protein
MTKTLRIAASVVVVCAMATATLVACQKLSDIFAHYGDNQYNNHYIEVHRGITASSGGWLEPGAEGTYAKVRIVGYPWGECTAGSEVGGWCEDNAHWDGNISRSDATMVTTSDFVPVGTWQYESTTFIDHEQEDFRSTDRNFGWPPSRPGDGYCVSYDYSQSENAWLCNQSPILIATGHAQSYTLSKHPVFFDINGDGVVEHIYWTALDADVAFLAYDADGNGQIDHGKELFGNFTVPGQPNGFAALQALSGVAGGELTDAHPFFARLLLWTDRNHDALSDPSELQPASDVLSAIGLGAGEHKRKDGLGNLFRFRGWARKALPGNNPKKEAREFTIYDVSFATALPK